MIRTANESVLMDIINLINNGSPGDAVKNVIPFLSTSKRPSRGSLTRSAKNLTMTFPIIVSSTVSTESSEMVADYLDTKFSALLQMLIAASSTYNFSDIDQMLSTYHTNLDEGAKIKTSNVIYESEKKLVYDNYLYLLQEDASNNIGKIDDCRSSLSKSGYTIKIKRQNINTDYIFDSKQDKNIAYSKPAIYLSECNNTGSGSMQDLLYRISGVESSVDQKRFERYNKSLPHVMKVNFFSKQIKKGELNKLTVLIGVKTKLYNIKPLEIYEKLTSKQASRISFFNFIRAMSSEIKFWKDFVFALKSVKKSAVDIAAKKSDKIWQVLERRAVLKKYYRSLNMTNNANAITTLVLSMEDVENMRKYYNMDPSDSEVARAILDDYNLIGICILDDATECARVIFDTGNDNYEILSYRTISHSEKMDYKKIINLMSKM